MIAKTQKEFHEIVCEQDKYLCHICKKSFNYPCYFDENGVNQYVCAHHFLSKGSRPDLKLETNIGKCTCFKCHTKIHAGYYKTASNLNLNTKVDLHIPNKKTPIGAKK